MGRPFGGPYHTQLSLVAMASGIMRQIPWGVVGGNRGQARTVAYTIEYSPETDGHLRVLTARQRTLVFDTVDRQLAHQPTVETRNRKPMRPNPVAPWELRIGKL